MWWGKLCPHSSDAQEVSRVTAQLNATKLQDLNLADETVITFLLLFKKIIIMVKQNGSLSQMVIMDKAFAHCFVLS